MYAEWFIGTAGITSVSKFGTGAWWVKIPDAFSPIQYIDTTSIAIPTDGDIHGCLIQTMDTTTVGHVSHITPRRVTGYVTGDKWFRLTGDPAIGESGQDKLERLQTKVMLYYRDASEGGEITA